MTVQELLIASQVKLRESGMSDPLREARLLLSGCLGVRTQNLNLLDDSYISEIKISKHGDIDRIVSKLLLECLSGVLVKDGKHRALFIIKILFVLIIWNVAYKDKTLN